MVMTPKARTHIEIDGKFYASGRLPEDLKQIGLSADIRAKYAAQTRLKKPSVHNKITLD